MKQSIIIRPECSDDISDIESVTIEAFKYAPHSSHKEQNIIARLREDNALTVSLVAEIDDEVVGHIAFSKVQINNEFDHWYGLAPVSVSPAYQHQGLGSQLIHTGLEAIKKLNAKGCVLLGEPEYYQRFGFKAVDSLVLAGVPPMYFQSLAFNDDLPSGEVKYHKAFV